MAPLRRRQWLALAGSGLLAASSNRHRLAVQGMLPALWQRKLPNDWAVDSLDLRLDLPPIKPSISSLVLSDGWAQALPTEQRRPWPAGPVTEGLLPIAQPVLGYGLPLGFGPWLLVLRNRADLLNGGGLPGDGPCYWTQAFVANSYCPPVLELYSRLPAASVSRRADSAAPAGPGVWRS